MKRLSQILAILTMALAPLLAGGTAFAASTCQVGYTGPDSNNLCTSVTTYQCMVENNTVTVLDGQNTQVAVSGDSEGNSAATGSATNSNGVTFNVTVTNNESEEGVCSVVATIPAIVTPTPTPQSGGGGALVLPNTSSDQSLAYITAFAVALGLGALVVRLAATAYSHSRR